MFALLASKVFKQVSKQTTIVGKGGERVKRYFIHIMAISKQYKPLHPCFFLNLFIFFYFDLGLIFHEKNHTNVQQQKVARFV